MKIPVDRIKRNGKIDLWDLGPQVSPKPPEAPEEPDKAKLKGTILAAAELEYEDACAVYKDALRTYNEAKKAHLAWHRDIGGPVQVELWGVDATHALNLEPDRYKLDLPKGMKPGKAQEQAEERSAIEAQELERLRAKDPQFGTQGARA